MNAGWKLVLAATAAVFIADRRVGSAVLVDDRHLVTAKHVLLRIDPETGAKSLVPQVTLQFAAVTVMHADRFVASRVDVGSGGDARDVAVLELADPRPQWLPAPVVVWPAGRMPPRVEVFGYPLAESSLTGVWREFTVSGPTAAETVQLDWPVDVGTFPGHSGGPVVDPETGALVGILVQGSMEGRFDRFLPVTVIAQLWPGLPRGWLMSGLGGRGHFARRARGQRSRARGGDLFRGRSAAVAAVRDWLLAEEAPGLPLVITGQPGGGKSAVLARAVLELEAHRLAPGLGFHGQGATHADLLAAVSNLIGLERVDARDTLLDALEDVQSPLAPWRIAVDALDEVATAEDRRQSAETLTELAALPNVRVAVATRPLAASDRERYLPGGLLTILGATGPDSTNLVDLDTDRYFDLAGIEDFAAALLSQDGVDRPGPPGRAWTSYRAHPDVRNRVARVVGRRARRNYLVVAMAAVPLSEAPTPIDPARPGFEERSIPSGVGEALGKYLDALPELDKARTRGLLTALAYARGAGIDAQLWIGFAAALGYTAEMVDLDQLRASTAADYLLQTVVGNTGSLTRLFHQALTDELLAARHRPNDEHQLLHTLLARVTASGGWARANTYERWHAAEHAASAGELPGLLDDPHYLTVADFPRLLPLLSSQPAVDATAAVVRQAGIRAAPLPPVRRARLLALAAAHLGLSNIRRRLADVCDDGIRPRWAHSLGAPHRELTGHTARVGSVALARIGDREAIISGSDDTTICVWDAATGQLLGNPLTGHNSIVAAVTLGPAGKRYVIVSGSWDKTIRVWDASTGKLLGGPLLGHTDWVTAVALGRVADRAVIISGSWDKTVRIWDANTGRCLRAPIEGHTAPVTSVALGRVGDRDVIVSGSNDTTVRAWDAATGRPIGQSMAGHAAPVTSVALGRVGDRDVIAFSGLDDAVHILDAATLVPLGEPLFGHTDWVTAVTLGRIDNREYIVSAGSDATIRIWDAMIGNNVGEPLAGNSRVVRAVALSRVRDREVIATGSDDSTVRLWEAATGRPIGEPWIGHTAPVTALALGHAGGREIVISGSADTTVRLWEVAIGRPIGEPWIGHTAPITAVALGRVDDRDVVVSGSADTTVRLWEAAIGRPIGEPWIGHTAPITAVALGRVNDRNLVVSGSADTTVRLWEAETGRPIGEPWTGHTAPVTALALGHVVGRDAIVSCSGDQTVHIWGEGDRRGFAIVDLLAPIGAVSVDGMLCVATGNALCVFGS